MQLQIQRLTNQFQYGEQLEKFEVDGEKEYGIDL